VIDQLVIHNGDKCRKASGYPRERPSLPLAFDTATGCGLLEDAQRDHTRDESKQRPQAGVALRIQLQGGRH
jgi:hypothetical protein